MRANGAFRLRSTTVIPNEHVQTRLIASPTQRNVYSVFFVQTLHCNVSHPAIFHHISNQNLTETLQCNVCTLSPSLLFVETRHCLVAWHKRIFCIFCTDVALQRLTPSNFPSHFPPKSHRDVAVQRLYAIFVISAVICRDKAVPCLYIIVVVIFAVICRDKALPCLMMQTTNRKISEQDYEILGF